VRTGLKPESKLDPSTISRIFEAGYVALSHSPDAIRYVKELRAAPEGEFAPLRRSRLNYFIQELKWLRGKGLPEIYDYFARLDKADYKKDISDSIRGRGIEAILLSEGTAELSPIWGEKVKTQIYAVPYLEKALSIRSPLSLTSGEIMQEHWIRDSLFYYPSFNRLQIREGTTRIIGREKSWNWQSIDSIYTTASDVMEMTRSLNFNEFDIDPILEVLSYYYITPIEVISAATATSGRRISIKCRDPLGVETTFFIGVDKYRKVFNDTHPQRILQEHKPYFMFFGYGYFNSESIFVDGVPIDREDYLRHNFLGYLRRRKRVDKETLTRRFPGLSLKEIDARAYEYSGRIYYVPGFATQEETMLLHEQREVPPYSRYKVPNARNQWSAYLYANPETEGLYSGKTTLDRLIIRPSNSLVLFAGETSQPEPILAPEELRKRMRHFVRKSAIETAFWISSSVGALSCPDLVTFGRN